MLERRARLQLELCLALVGLPGFLNLLVGQDIPPHGGDGGFDTANISIVPRVRSERGKPTHATLSVDVPVVLVPVTVTDPFGKPLTGLKAGTFRVFEDGVEQRITHFSNEDAPVSVGVLFDASASMTKKLDKSREAVAHFFRYATPGDEYFLVDFNDAPHLLATFTTDTAKLENQLALIQPRGWTALLDTIYVAVDRMKAARNGRKALFVLSDGADNYSRFTEREIRNILRESDVSVYSVGILGHGVTKRSLKLLSDIADETGGLMVPISSLSELPEAVASISGAIRDQYVLGYHPTNPERNGKYRRVRVKVEQPPDVPPLHASWRVGYFAPY